ncbi:MAG: hypothetical protein HWE18_02710 [Gammaproteobacteria bacterium]|nr:hypothetical protein [Gammaproteobacteria bacterium]
MKIKIIFSFVVSLIFTISAYSQELDSDGDGYSDDKELLLGTDPNFDEYQTRMPNYVGFGSGFLANPSSQSHSSKEAQSVITPDDKFIIGLRKYQLKAYRINTDGRLEYQTGVTTSDYISTDHNDLSAYAYYHLAMSPNGEYLAVYNPTLPRNKRVGIYNSNIELYKLTLSCSETGDISLNLIQRFFIPDQMYSYYIYSLSFSEDSKSLYTTEANGLVSYSITKDGLLEKQRIAGVGGKIALLKGKLATTSGHIFDVHSPSGFLMNKKSFDPGVYTTDDIVANKNNNTFWAFRGGDDLLDVTYINEFSVNGEFIRKVGSVIGNSIQINSKAAYISLQDEEYGSMRVYSADGDYIGHTYKAINSHISNIEEVNSTSNGEWLFITTPTGTYTYKGAVKKKEHEDIDQDGVLDINDNYPLDSNLQ